MESKLVYGAIAVVILVGVSVAFLWQTEQEQFPLRVELTELAQCLDQNGAKFYGAFWCPYCAEQKAIFSTAAKKLPYLECSTADREGQVQLCIDESIVVYPTWRFANAMECTGPVGVEVLAHLSGCAVPKKGEETVTVKSLYERLILTDLKESLKQSEIEEGSEEWETRMTETQERVDELLVASLGTTLEETTDVDAFLSVIAREVEGCEERQIEEVEAEVVEQS